LAAACSAAVIGTSEAPKSICPALIAAMPALLPTAEYPILTPRCCCWYLAKATEKNGASNVDSAPVRVGGWPPGAGRGDDGRSGARAAGAGAGGGEQRDRRGGGPGGCMW
jgi:hypothetical protein